jgi:hypothetical protein
MKKQLRRGYGTSTCTATVQAGTFISKQPRNTIAIAEALPVASISHRRGCSECDGDRATITSASIGSHILSCEHMIFDGLAGLLSNSRFDVH